MRRSSDILFTCSSTLKLASIPAGYMGIDAMGLTGRGKPCVAEGATFRCAGARGRTCRAGRLSFAQTPSKPVSPGPGDPRIKEFMYDPNAIVAMQAASSATK